MVFRLFLRGKAASEDFDLAFVGFGLHRIFHCPTLSCESSFAESVHHPARMPAVLIRLQHISAELKLIDGGLPEKPAPDRAPQPVGANKKNRHGQNLSRERRQSI